MRNLVAGLLLLLFVMCSNQNGRPRRTKKPFAGCRRFFATPGQSMVVTS